MKKKDISQAESPMTIYATIESGISFSQFESISYPELLSLEEWASILELTERSLYTYKKDNRQFKSLQSEKIFEIQEIMEHGMDTFGSIEKFRSWLITPRSIFAGKTPKDLLRNSYGIRIVQSQLDAIDHGILA